MNKSLNAILALAALIAGAASLLDVAAPTLLDAGASRASAAGEARPQPVAAANPAVSRQSLTPQPPTTTVPHLTDLKLIRVPLARQATDFTCGAAALQSVLGFYGQDVREQELARNLGSNSYDGTNFRRIMKYAREHGYQAAVKTPMTLDELKQKLDEHVPVICLIQAWSGHKDTDYAHDWNDGHYVVAVGYDQDNVYFMDPSTLGNYTYIPTHEFTQRWHDREQHTRLPQLGLWITKPSPPYSPDAILKMD